MQSVIYEPKGPAREYAPLAANLYRGCSHGCRYCYAPGVLRISRADFARDPRPRPGVLAQLTKDAARLAARGETGPVLLSFTSDPYQPAEAACAVTRNAIRILHDAGLGIRLLTKNPGLALELTHILLQDADVEFGVSLSWTRDADRAEWEPYAGTVAERVGALAAARGAGLRTWVSIEPVIDAAQALDVLDVFEPGTFKVGKLNHDAAREARIDWRRFLVDVLERLEGRSCGYYIKEDLWRFADDEVRAKAKREREPRVADSDIGR